MTPRGAFISFEGIDGAGKSTHLDSCVQWLRAHGQSVVSTREPGGTPLAESLRSVMLDVAQQPPMSALTEVLLASAARSDHVHRLIEPALARGDWVVCDRFFDSTVAYQGAGRGVDPQLLQALERALPHGLQPLRTYCFDLDVQEAARRRSAARSADRFERESAEFFERVRSGYLDRVRQDPQRFLVIDARLSPAQVRQTLHDDLQSLLRSRT